MRTATLPLFLLLLGGCRSFYKEYRELPVRGLTADQVWEACLATAKTEFRLDPSQVDRGLKRFTTAWRTELRAFGKGRRRRAFFEIDSKAPEALRVRYYVERQKHVDMARPLRPREEDWEPDGQDPRVEIRLLHHLRIRLAYLAGRPTPGVHGVRMEDPARRK